MYHQVLWLKQNGAKKGASLDTEEHEKTCVELGREGKCEDAEQMHRQGLALR